jgi:glycine/D-amino acid oxidase-like deaminating enzyme
MRSGELGFWWRSLGGPPTRRPSLGGSTQADVAIVGAGFTGLWTAYYLKRARPELRIVVLERETAGFGASGRNGGWISGFFSGPGRVYARRGGDAGVRRLRRAMLDTVDEIVDVVNEHSIDADLVHHGQLSVAVNRAQLQRLREEIETAHSEGLDDGDLRELSSSELSVRVSVAGALGASFTPHVARTHPAKLVLGLARMVEEMGVEIYESTVVREIRPHEALTDCGAVRARWVVRATEGYTSSLRGLRRTLVPMNSSMVVTEPLDPGMWEQIGWQAHELLSDAAHVYVYLQRTADGRIAIGGRGVPYRYASRDNGTGETAPRTVRSLHEQLVAMFPNLGGIGLEHAWSGVLGVPRDWCVSVDADQANGLAWAGGYVGEGVAAANLAARILRDLILGEASELTSLPWVGRRPRRWEPEPLRWAAIHGVYALYRQADRHERGSAGPSRLGSLVDVLSGRH